MILSMQLLSVSRLEILLKIYRRKINLTDTKRICLLRYIVTYRSLAVTGIQFEQPINSMNYSFNLHSNKDNHFIIFNCIFTFWECIHIRCFSFYFFISKNILDIKESYFKKTLKIILTLLYIEFIPYLEMVS